MHTEQENSSIPPWRVPLRGRREKTAHWVERYQSLIGTIVGFAGVIITLSIQGCETRQAERDKLERAGINTALVLFQDFTAQAHGEAMLALDGDFRADHRPLDKIAAQDCLTLVQKIHAAFAKPVLSPWPSTGPLDLSSVPVAFQSLYLQGVTAVAEVKRAADVGIEGGCATNTVSTLERLRRSTSRAAKITIRLWEVEPLSSLEEKAGGEKILEDL